MKISRNTGGAQEPGRQNGAAQAPRRTPERAAASQRPEDDALRMANAHAAAPQRPAPHSVTPAQPAAIHRAATPAPKQERPAASPPPRRPAPRPQPEPAYEEEDEDEEYEGRPRWHRPLGCLVILIFAALIGFGAWEINRLYAEVSGASELGEETEFYVEQGASVSDIATQLMEAGLVEHDWLFRYYTQYSGKASGVQYGAHPLRAGMSYNDILDSLSQQVERRHTVTLTFPEGTTAVGIARILEENELCTVQEFLDCANGTDGSDFSQYAFWNQIPDNPGRLFKCEGYLFPNTYEFYTDEDPYYYVDVFYKEFDRQTADLVASAGENGMTLDEAVILASFIQEEAGFNTGEENLLNNQRVAACFYNRLHSTDPLWSGHQLQSNASSYITNDGDNNYLWNSPMAEYMGWREAGVIPEEVLAAYDTYRISGLPAGAISNPGRIALEAALQPDQQYIDEGYYFFVTGHPDTDVAGQYFFAKTADEHLQNVAIAGWAS